MKLTDPLALSIIFLDGYDTALAGEPRATNPYEKPFAEVWFEGWDKGDAARYGSRKPSPTTMA